MPRVVTIDPESPDARTIAIAAEVLGRGGLVAFPTETVYGLGARGLRAAEVARIFAAKGRPSGHPLILHVDGEAMARSLTQEFSPLASRLASALWPGPLTLVVPRSAVVPNEVTGGLETVAVRAPSHPVARALIRAVGEPLAAPSANAHTSVSPTTADHVVRSLGDAVDLVLDGGPCAFGIESTVVALAAADGVPRVLRPGAVSLTRLRAVEPSIVYEPQTLTVAGDEPRPAPGMASKHYAPRARVVLAAPADFARAVTDASATSKRVAAIALTDEGRRVSDMCLLAVTLPGSPEGYARGLYAALHAVDVAGSEVVVVEDVPSSDPAWWAVVDRLARAATR